MDLRPERLERIVQMLNRRGGLRTAELADALQVSAATVRRDLDELASRGAIDRTHGGAVILHGGTAREAPYAEKAQRMQAEKERIAQRAAELVPDGATIVLDSGTTVLELSRRLAGRSVTAIALDLPSAMALSSEEGVEVWVPGGRVRNGLFSLVGSWVEQSLQSLSIDLFFMGADAIDHDGVSNTTVEEAEVKRLALRAARSRILLADSSKFGKRSFVSVCSLGAISTLITDDASRPALEEVDEPSLQVEYV